MALSAASINKKRAKHRQSRKGKSYLTVKTLKVVKQEPTQLPDDTVLML